MDRGLGKKELLAPCLPLGPLLQQPTKMENKTPLLGWWGYLLFCCVGGGGGCHPGFAKVPENSREESTSCYQLLSLDEIGYAACRYEGVY